MPDFERELRHYKKEIKKLLLVKTDASRRFLEELECNIADFVENEKTPDLNAVTARFGTPDEIAREFLANTDIAAVRRRLRLKTVILSILLAALLLWGAVLGALYVQAKNDLDGSYTVGTEVIKENAP